MRRSVRLTAATTVVALLGSWGCSTTATGPSAVRTELVSVTPQGSATGVNPSGSRIVLRFSQPMSAGMEMYAALHEGDVTGPTVPCTATWSTARDTLTFVPSMPLKTGTHYTLHVGGGMKDAYGNVIDMSRYGSMMGGQWATSSMMSGGGMMGGNGPMSGQEMGPGWAGTNGMYGMVFSFTTS